MNEILLTIALLCTYKGPDAEIKKDKCIHHMKSCAITKERNWASLEKVLKCLNTRPEGEK